MGATVSGAPVAQASNEFEVLLVNGPSVAAWLACETQWRIVAGPARLHWIGLDYGAVDIVLRRLEIADADKVFRDLQVMEGEALSVFWGTES